MAFLQIFGLPWSSDSPNYEFELLEEQPPSTILTTLHATDGDSTISEYHIIDGDDGKQYFEINNITGMCFYKLLFYKYFTSFQFSQFVSTFIAIFVKTMCSIVSN